MNHLRLCPSCARRVYLTEETCPFCQAPLEALGEHTPSVVASREWMGRAQFLAVAAAVTSQVLTGCGDSHKHPMGGAGGTTGGSGGQASTGGTGGCDGGACGGVGGGGVGGGGYGGFGGVYGGAPAPYFGGVGGNDTGGTDGNAHDDAGTIDSGDKDAAP